MNYKISKELYETVYNLKISESNFSYIQEEGCHYKLNINDFFFKCIDYLQKNNINIDLNTNSDLRADVFEFIDNLLKVNKRN